LGYPIVVAGILRSIKSSQPAACAGNDPIDKDNPSAVETKNAALNTILAVSDTLSSQHLAPSALGTCGAAADEGAGVSALLSLPLSRPSCR
jgi:hypothetical protein